MVTRSCSLTSSLTRLEEEGEENVSAFCQSNNSQTQQRRNSRGLGFWFVDFLFYLVIISSCVFLSLPIARSPVLLVFCAHLCSCAPPHTCLTTALLFWFAFKPVLSPHFLLVSSVVILCLQYLFPAPCVLLFFFPFYFLSCLFLWPHFGPDII